VASEVEERIHKALQSHPLERTDDGYRLVHKSGAGISSLRLLPSAAAPTPDGRRVAAVVEIVAEYRAPGLPPFHAEGVQRLNAMAVHGAYEMRGGSLRQTAQFSIYGNEPASHLAVQTILNAFGSQLPIGLSTALAITSAAALEQQRAHHGMARVWRNPLADGVLEAAKATLQGQGLAASNSTSAVWAEFPMSGDCPSRTIDPAAQTAMLQVNTGIAHPIAGAGYLATISLPLPRPLPSADCAEICRRLNALELKEIDFAPRIGAWGLHGPDSVPAYSCFLPAAEPSGELPLAIMWWCVRRAAWLRERFWQPQAGMSLESLPA
jgi:hypothetical protein